MKSEVILCGILIPPHETKMQQTNHDAQSICTFSIEIIVFFPWSLRKSSPQCRSVGSFRVDFRQDQMIRGVAHDPCKLARVRQPPPAGRTLSTWAHPRAPSLSLSNYSHNSHARTGHRLKQEYINVLNERNENVSSISLLFFDLCRPCTERLRIPTRVAGRGGSGLFRAGRFPFCRSNMITAQFNNLLKRRTLQTLWISKADLPYSSAASAYGPVPSALVFTLIWTSLQAAALGIIGWLLLTRQSWQTPQTLGAARELPSWMASIALNDAIDIGYFNNQ